MIEDNVFIGANNTVLYDVKVGIMSSLEREVL